MNNSLLQGENPPTARYSLYYSATLNLKVPEGSFTIRTHFLFCNALAKTGGFSFSLARFSPFTLGAKPWQEQNGAMNFYDGEKNLHTRSFKTIFRI